MKSYKLSVRLMTYNHGNYIEEALKGIDIQKTNFSFEVVIGDDFSTDDTLSKIRVYNFTNPNIDLRILKREVGDSYHKQRKKKGRLYNFVDILNNCTGEYIALLDGDDYWTDPLKLQKQVDFLEDNDNYVLAYHDLKVIDHLNTELKTSKLKPCYKNDFSEVELMQSPYLHVSTFCFRNVNQIFPQEFLKVFNADRFLISLLGSFGRGKYLTGISPSIYRVHPKGIYNSLNCFDKDLNEFFTFYHLFKFHQRNGNENASKFFYQEFKKKCFYFLNKPLGFAEDKKIAVNFFRLKKYKLSINYFVYKFLIKKANKGYFFRRRFLHEIDSI